MFINVDWFFYSHRLPVANAAKKFNFDMSVFTDLTIRKKGNFNHQFDLNQSPLRNQKFLLKYLMNF